MKDWTKKTMVEEDERLNKIKNAKKKKKKKIRRRRRKDANDVMQKEFCKIYCKTCNVIYIV